MKSACYLVDNFVIFSREIILKSLPKIYSFASLEAFVKPTLRKRPFNI